MQLTAITRGHSQDWLSLFIAEINSILQRMVQKNEIPSELKELERKFATVVIDKAKLEENENPMKQVTILRENVAQFLVRNIILDYVHLLTEKNLVPENNLEVAFDFYGKGILVWIHTPEEDDNTETVCKQIEETINKKYVEYDITMSTNFTDPSLGIPFPPNYI